MVPDTGGTINSVQNGLLLRSDIHQLFDFYDFSINPDVCVSYTSYRGVIANYYLRIITRLSASTTLTFMGTVSLVNILTKDFLIIPKDQLINFYAGIFGKLFSLI